MNSEINTNDYLNAIMEVERVTLAIKCNFEEMAIKEEKKNKLKDLMSNFKEGKVQKDPSLSFYFDDSMFIKFSRKDLLSNIENDSAKFNKELTCLKDNTEVLKKTLIEILLKNNLQITEIDDDHVLKYIQYDYSKTTNK
jgi:hypothetical protein